MRGEKNAMIAHLIGANACQNASAAAKKLARRLKAEKSEVEVAENGGSDADNEDETGRGPARKKRCLFETTKKEMQQTELKVFRGIDVPFNQAQAELVQHQFLRATISANLPFQWTENVEVIKLFLMFRSAATNVVPTRNVLSGCLLDIADKDVEREVKQAIAGTLARTWPLM